MSEKISTDAATVKSLTSKFTSSLSSLSFKPKQTSSMSFSESSAASAMKSSVSSLSSVVSTFKSNASKDIGNLEKIHQAIKQAEKNAVK
jgi:SpoVK/Ycf46/Vps4 family AAA+-type ATPase